MKNKKGSIYIEAAIVIPITLIVSIGMLCIAMIFYENLWQQSMQHKEELEQTSHAVQMEIIRNYVGILQ